jgi:hypothetical protein
MNKRWNAEEDSGDSGVSEEYWSLFSQYLSLGMISLCVPFEDWDIVVAHMTRHFRFLPGPFKLKCRQLAREPGVRMEN